MDVERYLKRIGYDGVLTPDLKVLGALQTAHLLHIPFENLDIHYGNRIVLDTVHLFRKIVVNQRGGFCYELNGLFNELLKELGFRTRLISARVYESDTGTFGPEFDHMAIIVTIGQDEYLVDVGFGEFAFHPLCLKTGIRQEDPRGMYVIESYDEKILRVSRAEGDDFIPEHIFSTTPRDISDFEKMCEYHQKDSRSMFTAKKLITRPTLEGRITISGNTLKMREDSFVVKDLEFPDEEFSFHLRKWFDMDDLTF